MFHTQVLRLSQPGHRGMGNQILSVTIVMIVAVLVAIVFFGMNPSRVGEITIATPNGPSMTFKVADSNDISELSRKGWKTRIPRIP